MAITKDIKKTTPKKEVAPKNTISKPTVEQVVEAPKVETPIIKRKSSSFLMSFLNVLTLSLFFNIQRAKKKIKKVKVVSIRISDGVIFIGPTI